MKDMAKSILPMLLASVLLPVGGSAQPAAALPDLQVVEHGRIMKKAEALLDEAPRTVTADRAARSAGGPHDFYSEGDYWWPDPEHPDGPYVRRDGQSNPDNFAAHRHAMIRLSEVVGTMASAWLLTRDERYARHGVAHLKAWFVEAETRMNPDLKYAQAIQGRSTGRSIGIIDTLHLAEVARGALVLRDAPAFAPEDFRLVQQWFRRYLTWLTTSEFGRQERDAGNNHGICWSVQAAAFAELVGDREVLDWVRARFKEVYLGDMMAKDGSLPRELARTKPYGYALFTIDALAAVAQIASVPGDDLWTHTLPDGRGMALGMRFIFPFIRDKTSWPYPKDIMHWKDWPVRHPSLIFAGLAYGEPEYLGVALGLEADPAEAEVVRNLPLRHPLLWVNPDGTPRHFTMEPVPE